MEDKTEKLTEKATEAQNLEKDLSEDMKLAVEAMRRTVRYRNTRIVVQERHIYEQIV